jgi:hypothetical protein
MGSSEGLGGLLSGSVGLSLAGGGVSSGVILVTAASEGGSEDDEGKSQLAHLSFLHTPFIRDSEIYQELVNV